MADWWTAYINRRARALGLDPAAVLSVASAEGLSGGVGDAGTSFGPFQLHVGGALPSGRGRAWAESQSGIDYALGQIAGVARGLRGRNAISNIVSRFERPADPSGEIERAWGAYGNYRKGTPDLRNLPYNPSSQKPSFRKLPVQRGESMNIGALLRQRLGQGGFDLGDLVRLRQQRLAQELQQTQARAKPALMPSAAGPASVTPAGAGPALTGEGYAMPGKGKIIGTPGAGTHTLGNWESDRALDIAMPVGSPIYSPFAGTVGSQFGSLGASAGSRFAGLRMHIASPENEWYGAHLSRFAAGIAPGVRVKRGQLIGYSGSAAGVPHLHESLKSGDPYWLVR